MRSYDRETLTLTLGNVWLPVADRKIVKVGAQSVVPDEMFCSGIRFAFLLMAELHVAVHNWFRDYSHHPLPTGDGWKVPALWLMGSTDVQATRSYARLHASLAMRVFPAVIHTLLSACPTVSDGFASLPVHNMTDHRAEQHLEDFLACMHEQGGEGPLFVWMLQNTDCHESVFLQVTSRPTKALLIGIPRPGSRLKCVHRMFSQTSSWSGVLKMHQLGTGKKVHIH